MRTVTVRTEVVYRRKDDTSPITFELGEGEYITHTEFIGPAIVAQIVHDEYFRQEYNDGSN